MTTPLRIVSLLPSATEIVAALGLGDYLVGRSHECDFPATVTALPICTEPKFDPEGDSREIHGRVTDLLQSALSVYRVKTEVLATLRPTHIITQAQCEVCAVSLKDVEAAVAQFTDGQPQVISLQPQTLAEVWQDLERVGQALGSDAAPVVQALKNRVDHCQRRVAAASQRPRVACIEWIEPLMAAGNWLPELVSLAGGCSLFATPKQSSPWLSWEDLAQADPEVIVFMPCGFDLARTQLEATATLQQPRWQALGAVRAGRLYGTDGNAYFNRPGPRLVESLEILAEILHPAIAPSRHQGTGWQPLQP